VYRIEYSPEAIDHLRTCTARQRAIIIDAIERQLTYQPTAETTNRKPMRPNPLAPWELRMGSLRVYYEVAEHAEPLVYIRAVGITQRNRVICGGEEMRL
jgi:mRNA-degrading endonuclease RelE of RelBE toxin-antitoxin system